nr:fibronectin type III domain-containing protein [Candidatus Gracilibacteria bacterium]
MRKIFLFLIFIFTFFVSNFTYAISSLTKAPYLVTSSATTLSISWDKVTDAMGYYVYYSTVSGKDYKNFGDAFAENKAILSNLLPNTTYYVVVTAFDNKNNESFNSPEGVFNTKTGFGDKFGLTEINPVNFNELELIFNSLLDSSSGAIREFRISQNNKEVALVKDTKLNTKEKNKLNLILNKNLSPGEYKLTILYITDSTGRNIEEGIDAETKFIIPSTFTPSTSTSSADGKLTPNSTYTNTTTSTTTTVITGTTNSTENNQDQNIDLNSAPDNVDDQIPPQDNTVTQTSVQGNIYNQTSTQDNVNNQPQSQDNIDNQNQIELNSGVMQTEDYGLAGKDIGGVSPTSEEIALGNKKLPTSGPESIFIVFMSIFLASLLIYFRKKHI